MSIRPTTSLCPSASKPATFQGLSFSEILVCKDTTKKTTESYAALMQEWKSLLPKDHVVFPRPTFLSLPSEIIFNVFSFTGSARNFNRLGATCTQLFRLSITEHAPKLFWDRLQSELAQYKSSVLESKSRVDEAYSAYCLALENHKLEKITSADLQIKRAAYYNMNSDHNAFTIDYFEIIHEFNSKITYAKCLFPDFVWWGRGSIDKNAILAPSPTQTKSDS